MQNIFEIIIPQCHYKSFSQQLMISAELLFTVTCPVKKKKKKIVLISLWAVLSLRLLHCTWRLTCFPIADVQMGESGKGSEWELVSMWSSWLGRVGYCSYHFPTTYRDNAASQTVHTHNFQVKIPSLFFNQSHLHFNLYSFSLSHRQRP